VRIGQRHVADLGTDELSALKERLHEERIELALRKRDWKNG
jgi:hypothetical protein